MHLALLLNQSAPHPRRLEAPQQGRARFRFTGPHGSPLIFLALEKSFELVLS